MTNKFLYSAFALAALGAGLTACSADNEPNMPEAGKEGKAYVAVNIMSAAGANTRAGENYEVGSDDENALNDVRFLFFDAAGKAFNMAQSTGVNGTVSNTNVVKPTITAGKTDGDKVAGTAVLVLGTATDPYQGLVPYQAVCIANLTDAQFQALGGQDLKTVAETLNEAPAYTNGNFVMSSSNWDGAPTNGAVLLTGAIKGSADEAEDSPVNFFIERLAAKVKVTGLEAHVSQKENNGGDETYDVFIDGVKKQVKLQVNITDWKLLNRATKAYTIKQLPTSAPWTDASNPWSSADYHRCFWAATPDENTVALIEGSKKFDILSTTDGEWVEDDQYTYEFINTSLADDVAAGTRGAMTTAIAVRGYVQIVPEEGGTAQNLDLCKFAGGYYDKETLLKNALEQCAATETNQLTLVKEAGKNTYAIQYNNQTVGIFSGIQYWNGGATSFVYNINNEQNKFGIVRNHVYKLNIQNVVGLGVPGNEDEKPDDTETYLAATLDVLNWRIVSKSITLE